MLRTPSATRGSLVQLLRQEFSERGWPSWCPPPVERYARHPGETKTVHGRTYRLNENHRWEKVVDHAESSPRVVVSGKEFGEGLSGSELRARAMQYWRDHLKGRSFKNADTGRQIGISRDGIAKLLSFSGDTRRALLVARLPDLLEDAAYSYSEPPDKPGSKYRTYHHFLAEATLAGAAVDIHLLIGEDPNGNWLYQVADVQERRRPAPSQGPRSEPDGLPVNGGPSLAIIDPNKGEVKKNSRKADANLAERFARVFRQLGWPEPYARHKSGAGQGHLFREEDHPRNAEGEFTEKGTGQSAHVHAEQPKQLESLAGQKDLFGGETAKGTAAKPKADESASAPAKQRQATLFHGLGDAPGQQDLFDLDYRDSQEPHSPGSASPSEKERSLYADYVKLVEQFHLSGKLEFEPWLSGYREQQARLAGKLQQPPPAAPSPPQPPAKADAPQHVERKITQRKKIVEDFGEKIGGARKDTARKLGPRADRLQETDDRPGWMRRYQVSQITKSSRPEEEGKWAIYDTKSKGWGGSFRQVGSTLFSSQQEALAALPLAEVARNHRVSSYRDQDGQTRYAIVRNVSDHKRPTVKGGFASHDEAKRYMAVNPTEIIEHEFPRYETFQYLDHVERTGGTNRSGDIRPKEFHTEFGFRGGEFGNWQQGQEGQVALNHAYDALHDLADILKLPPRAVSLNGRLSIAFGARGTGGKMAARAHHEPDKRVINLTKMRGAGTLSHEWSHALDHYFGEEADAGRHPETRPAASDGLPHNHGLRPEVATAWKQLLDTMTTKEVTTAIDANKAQTVKKKARQAVAERIAEVEESLKSQSRYNQRFKPFTPEQQEEWDRLKDQLVSGDVGPAKWVEGKSRFGGYHTYEPLERLNTLYKAATGRSFHTADNKSLGSSIYWQVQHANDMDRRAKEAGEGKTETRRQRTAYLEAASRMDTTRESSYYTIPTEMLSRAFEAYVYDKLGEQSRKSDYLVGKAENKYYRMFDLEPFPEGDERAAINAAFDRFFSTVRHEIASQEKGGHVRLYSRRAGFDADVARLSKALESRGYRIRYGAPASVST